MTIRELNLLDKPAFIDALGWIFEGSPWVADRSFGLKPFRDLDALSSAMTVAVAQATRDEQLALLRAHPDLGGRARMSEASVGEQAGVGLDRLTPVEFDELQRLNTAYRQRFGFPFILAVKGSTKGQVLEALGERLTRDAAEEFAEALGQAGRIARSRLQELLGG